MILQLHNIGKKKKARKRLGRGNSSGHGTYSGKGQKGQRARSGGKGGLELFGFRRTLLSTPKMKGMKPRDKSQVVLLSSLEKAFVNGDKVTPAALLDKKLIRATWPSIKLLVGGNNKLTKKLDIVDCRVSAAAKEQIENVGGAVPATDKIGAVEKK